jgi:hypothetical protein
MGLGLAVLQAIDLVVEVILVALEYLVCLGDGGKSCGV